MVLEQLAGLTGESEWRDAADDSIDLSRDRSAIIPGHSLHCWPCQIRYIRIGELIGTGSYLPAELTAYLRNHPAHGLSILFKSPETESSLSEAAPLQLAIRCLNGVQFGICAKNGTCKVPVTDFKNLSL